VLHRLLPRDRCLQLQRSERKCPGRVEIPLAMLVVNRKRFGRFTDEGRGTRAQFENAAPGRRGCFVPAKPPGKRRMCAQRLCAGDLPVVGDDLQVGLRRASKRV
jgi:hypothetical protein